MGLECYIAMTAEELSAASSLPPRLAWMACHFSCYGLGLSNMPTRLPPGSLLILNDRTPICGHDPAYIRSQLEGFSEIGGLLLDLQRPGDRETANLVAALTQAPPWPVAVTEHYARDADCAVFLSPPPLHKPLQEYIAPWAGRALWLEVAVGSVTVTVTRQGSSFQPGPVCPVPEPAFEEDRLHMRYHVAVQPQAAVFTLVQTPEHLPALLQEAEMLGIQRAVGLYQQLKNTSF